MNLYKSRMLGLPVVVTLILTFLLGIAAFLPALVAWFTTEELSLVYAVRQDPFAVWTGADRQPGFFRPLIPMIVWIGDSLWGLEPRPYHILNVLLHLGNSLLVYVIARRWVAYLPEDHRLRHWDAAAAAALFFWLWPAHSEAVAWIPAMTDVAATTGALASLAAYLVYRSGGGVAWAAMALAMFMVALAAKEAAISLPAAVFIYEGTRATVLREWRGRSFLVPILYTVTLGLYFVLRKWLMGGFIGGYGSGVHGNFTWDHLRWTLSPNLAHAFLPVPGLSVAVKNWVIVGFFVASIGAVIWRSRRSVRSALPVLALAAAGLLVFVPGLNLGPRYITEGQRFAYMPSAFGAAYLAMTIFIVLPRGRVLLAMIWVVALAGAGALASYNMNWYTAGKVARSLVRDMKKLPDARRTYVLTITASHREAFVIPHSLEAAYKLFVPDGGAGEIVIASKVSDWEPDRPVYVAQVEPPGGMGGDGGPVYGLSVPAPEGNHPVQMRLDGFINPYTAQWFEVRQEGAAVFVGLKDYDPATDQIYYMDGDEWVIVAPRA